MIGRVPNTVVLLAQEEMDAATRTSVGYRHPASSQPLPPIRRSA